MVVAFKIKKPDGTYFEAHEPPYTEAGDGDLQGHGGRASADDLTDARQQQRQGQQAEL